MKVGGLGDVVTGLARACIARGHEVEIILPYYQCIPNDAVENLRHWMDFDCPKARFWDGHWQEGSLKTSGWKGKIAGVIAANFAHLIPPVNQGTFDVEPYFCEGVPVILLRPDWGATNIFQGDRIYGGSYNETEAYLYFSRYANIYSLLLNPKSHVGICQACLNALCSKKC